MKHWIITVFPVALGFTIHIWIVATDNSAVTYTNSSIEFFVCEIKRFPSLNSSEVFSHNRQLEFFSKDPVLDFSRKSSADILGMGNSNWKDLVGDVEANAAETNHYQNEAWNNYYHYPTFTATCFLGHGKSALKSLWKWNLYVRSCDHLISVCKPDKYKRLSF